jgi:hypothetical protein
VVQVEVALVVILVTVDTAAAPMELAEVMDLVEQVVVAEVGVVYVAPMRLTLEVEVV